MPNKSSSKPYSEEAITLCLQSIEAGKSIYAGCKEFGVPISTIRYRLSGKWQHKYKPGPHSVLSAKEEKQVVNWLSAMQDRGFPVTRDALLFKITEFLSVNSRENPFKNNRPGRKWFKGFMRCNPGFSLRTPEQVSSASGRVTETDLRGWFETVSNWLTKNILREVLEDPTRVFNGDETSFYLHPSTKEVIARTGSRNVYEIEQAAGKQNVTVMFSFGASGVVVSPHVIVPGKRIRKEVAQGFPPDWGLGQSERGWMDTHNFREYILKIFHPFLLKQGVTFPIIYFVDGHASHKAVEVADLCQSLGIVLISLYPNTTHITQPADVAVFKPLKSEWRKVVEEWRLEHQGESLTLRHFGGVLNTTVSRAIKSSTIQNGFRACGLQPFDANAVDFTKCIAKPSSSSTNGSSSLQEPVLPNVLQSLHEPHQSESERPSDQVTTPEQFPDLTGSLEQSSEYVRIHIDKIIEANDLIGHETMQKIEGDVNRLTREERVIRFFFREFVRPYVKFNDLSTSKDHNSSLMQLDLEETHNPCFSPTIPADTDFSECQIINMDNLDACNDRCDGPPILIEIRAEPKKEEMFIPQVTMDSTAQSVENAIAAQSLDNDNGNMCDDDLKDDDLNDDVLNDDLDVPTVSATEISPAKICPQKNNAEDEPGNFKESGNLLKDSTDSATKRSLSDILRLPPTPRRNPKHRNYSIQYTPVLTVGERLEAIRKKEAEKLEIEQTKKRKALERKDAKLKREEAKKARMEERERKKADSKQKKPKKLKRKTKN